MPFSKLSYESQKNDTSSTVKDKRSEIDTNVKDILKIDLFKYSSVEYLFTEFYPTTRVVSQ